MGVGKIGTAVGDFLWFGIWPWVERGDRTVKKQKKGKESEGFKGMEWEEAVNDSVGEGRGEPTQ